MFPAWEAIVEKNKVATSRDRVFTLGNQNQFVYTHSRKNFLFLKIGDPHIKIIFHEGNLSFEKPKHSYRRS